MNATGIWNLTIKTPMGEQKMRVQLIEDGETLTGTVQDGSQPAAAIKMGSIKGNQLGWKFDVKKPFPTTVTVALQLDGNAMTGSAKAGIFPPARVNGTRAE
jgi:hypothetical protein